MTTQLDFHRYPSVEKRYTNDPVESGALQKINKCFGDNDFKEIFEIATGRKSYDLTISFSNQWIELRSGNDTVTISKEFDVFYTRVFDDNFEHCQVKNQLKVYQLLSEKGVINL